MFRLSIVSSWTERSCQAICKFPTFDYCKRRACEARLLQCFFFRKLRLDQGGATRTFGVESLGAWRVCDFRESSKILCQSSLCFAAAPFGLTKYLNLRQIFDLINQ